MRAMREIVKLAYNITLQGKPVGDHDETVPCPQGGDVRVVGSATSNAVQGATFVKLEYTFAQCTYLQRDTDPKQNYRMTMTGSLAIDHAAKACPLVVGQDGNKISGTLCGREVGFSL